MRELELETLDAPANFGESTMSDAAAELSRLATTVAGLAAGPPALGFDDSGVALALVYTSAKDSLAQRLQYDAEAVRAAADALGAITAAYRKLIDANTPTAR